MGWFRNANLALAFLLELAMLASLAYWGFHATQNPVLKGVLGVGVPLLVIVFWGAFMAPRSPRHLTGMAYLIAQFVIFGLAVAGLAVAGQMLSAIILGALVIFNSLALQLGKPGSAEQSFS
ncbi:MAG: YrdB family protein [Ktedonobacterales bacterium]|nr:YrdB family protein [Ktedonobacterales bacterium]